MKKLFLLMVFALLGGFYARAQEDVENDKGVETIVIGILTKELSLTTDEAQKFWPIYNNYRNEIRQAMRDRNGGALEKQERVLNIRKRYQGEFGKALPQQKVNRYFVVEGKLINLLKKEMRQRQQNRIIHKRRV
jgi:hypothetical protein